MTRDELELAYLRAMFEWQNEAHNTRMMVLRQELPGFNEQLKKEEAALKKYHEAALTFVKAPKE